MDVDVHPFRLGFKEKEISRRIIFRDQFLIGLADRLVKERRAEIATVDEEELVAGALAGIFRIADVAAHADQRRIDLDFHQFLGQVHAVDVENALLAGGGGPQVVDLLAVGTQLEGHLRPDEGDAQELLDDGP